VPLYRRLFRLDNLGDPHTIVTVHDYYFPPRHHAVAQQKLGGVLKRLV
jgi:hypothetical protein